VYSLKCFAAIDCFMLVCNVPSQLFEMLSLAKIKSAFEINNIRSGSVTCYMDDIQMLRRFGEGQPTAMYPTGFRHACRPARRSTDSARSANSASISRAIFW
jgi:hypothetical protein